MNHSTSDKAVTSRSLTRTDPSSESVKRVKPVWLDIDQCVDSDYSIPSGFFDTHWEWNVDVPAKCRHRPLHVIGVASGRLVPSGKPSVAVAAQLSPAHLLGVRMRL